MMKIFEFEYNGKKYVSYVENNIIKFGYINNGVLNNRLSKMEDYFLKTIYNYIVGKKDDLIILKKFIYNKELITPLFNKSNNMFYFDCRSVKTAMLLNNLFNNQQGFLNKEESKDSKNNFFNIFVRIGSAVIAIAISSSFMLSTLPLVPNNELLFEADYNVDSIHMNDSVYDNSKYDIDTVLVSLESNSNLTDEEKHFLLNCKTELEENKDYINFEQLNRNLSEMQIAYHSSRGETNVEHIMYPLCGRYTYIGSNRNLIELYGNFDGSYYSEDFQSCDRSTLVHEFNHLLNEHNALINLPRVSGDIMEKVYLHMGGDSNQFEEMVNELFTREYLTDYTNQTQTDCYYWLMPAMYAMAEIIDPQVLRTYKFNSDNYFITNYLTNLGVPLNDIYDLYKSLDLVYTLYNESQSPHSTDVEIKAYKDNLDNIYRIISKCYECKYNKNMEDDINMKLCFYNTIYVNEEYNQSIRDQLGVERIYKVTPRGYVSSNYIAAHPNFSIYTNEQLTESIEITSDLRFVDSSNNISI